MEFKYCSIDPHKATKEELEIEIKRLELEMHEAFNTQQAYKLFINSAYGAIGNQYFQCYNPDIAEAVTLQGQDMIKYMNKAINGYFTKKWHRDTALHESLGIKVERPVINDVVVYGDTDSIFGEAMININDGIKLPIAFLWHEFAKINGFTIDSFGHEVVDNPNLGVLNYMEDNEIKRVGVSKIIRHEVKKPKWKLKTKTGKEIVITGDHSLIVFRDGEKLEVKPNQVLKTDKILVLKE